MRHRLLLLFVCFLALTNASAQLVTQNCFLQGRYVEIGMNRNGSFGACNNATYGVIPVGYHPHLPGTSALAEVYDFGHDGWTVGAPNYMGDYTYPGSPFEGWEVQIGTGRSQAFQNCPGNITNVGGMVMAGSHSAYSNTGGRAIGTWTGTATFTGGVGLQMRQQTRVDTLASCVVVTTVLKNTAAVVAPSVYYLRSCDPDNDQSWPGGGFFTNNTIVHQNQDATHKVLVSSVGAGYPAASYMGLGTKDCRAVCFIYSAWSIASSVDLAQVWNKTWTGGFGAVTYGLGLTQPGDVGIGLVYNIGNIPAGDSAVVSYAYIWNGNLGIDSAFPDPQIVVNGVPKPVVPVPGANFDTIDVCGTGLTTIPVHLLYADDKDWSWSTWTWLPGTGLSSSTGVSTTINVAGLPPTFTYTIVGTDSASGMKSCLNKVFYLTVKSCNTAINNSPCEGDTLKFNRPGDSTGATYVWYGPAPVTTSFSSLQAPFKYPATLSDSGLYTVVKTVGTVVTTDTTRVRIRPKPTLNMSSNIPLCGAMQANLTLSVNPTVTGNTYSWSGPGTFSSTLQNPTLSPFTLADTGYYTVIGTTSFGCKDTNSIFIYPGPIPSFDTTLKLGCTQDTILFYNTSDNADSYTWQFGDGTNMTTSSDTVFHIYTLQSAPVYSVTLTARNNRCANNITHTVDTRHSVTAGFTANDTVCIGNAINFVNTSTAKVPPSLSAGVIATNSWDFGDGSPVETTSTPTPHMYGTAGIYNAKLTVTDGIGCESVYNRDMYVLEPHLSGLTDTSICFTMPFQLIITPSLVPAIGLNNYSYTWTGTDISLLSDPTAQSPYFNSGVGDFTYTVNASLLPFGCPASHTLTIHSVAPAQLTNVTTEQFINMGESVQLNANNMVYFQWMPNDGSLTDPNINNPVATPTVTTTYAVFGFDIHGCRDTAWVIIHVDSSMQEFIPTAFSPNGDGKNDIFRPTFLKFQKLVEMRIFNRWGEQVFYSNNKEDGWDGTFNGKGQDMGTFYYQIIVARPGYGDNTVYKGEVTLIR